MLKIVQFKKIYVGIALALVIASIASLLIQGFALDTDFAGGTSITYTIEKSVSENDVKAIVKDTFGKEPSMIRITGKDVDIEVGHDQKLSDKENVDKANAAVEKLNFEVAKKWGKLSVIVDDEGVELTDGTGKKDEAVTETKKASELTE